MYKYGRADCLFVGWLPWSSWWIFLEKRLQIAQSSDKSSAGASERSLRNCGKSRRRIVGLIFGWLEELVTFLPRWRLDSGKAIPSEELWDRPEEGTSVELRRKLDRRRTAWTASHWSRTGVTRITGSFTKDRGRRDENHWICPKDCGFEWITIWIRCPWMMLCSLPRRWSSYSSSQNSVMLDAGLRLSG